MLLSLFGEMGLEGERESNGEEGEGEKAIDLRGMLEVGVLNWGRERGRRKKRNQEGKWRVGFGFGHGGGREKLVSKEFGERWRLRKVGFFFLGGSMKWGS